MVRKMNVWLVLSVLMIPGILAAQSAPPQAQDVDVQHQVSITISPIHLSMPMVELTGEYRLTDKMGVALILGAGSIKSLGRSYTALEAGAQYRYYVLGSFIHGLQLGAEILYLSLSGADAGIDAKGAGLAVGPFVGYKIATNIGFTFEVQGGAQYMAAGASATDGTNSASGKDSDIIPLLNLNVGWSF